MSGTEKNVAGYIRVSTEQQKQDGSHKRQEQKLKDWAKNKNYNIEFFRDIDVIVSKQKEELENN